MLGFQESAPDREGSAVGRVSDLDCNVGSITTSLVIIIK